MLRIASARLRPLQAAQSAASVAQERHCKSAACSRCKRRRAPRPWRRSATASPRPAAAASGAERLPPGIPGILSGKPRRHEEHEEEVMLLHQLASAFICG